MNDNKLPKVTIEAILYCLGHSDIDLFPTQHRLSIPIINRIYQKMVNKIKFDDIKVHDNLLMDGHHRYISSLLASLPINRIMTGKTSATRKYKWEDVAFVDEEWDTPEKIDKLNNDDAEFNDLPVSVIREMTK